MKYLVCGLGNIGPEYAGTRHNIGFMMADALAAEAEATFISDRYAFVTHLRYKGKLITLIKPTTYMNLSGKAVRYWLEKEKIPLDHLLVLSDDLDLPFGSLRLKPRGSGGSHNGLNNIIYTLENDNFARLRFGIGNNYPRGQQVDFVLGQFTEEERATILEKVKTTSEIIKSFATQGIDRTMNMYNKK